MEKKIFSLKWKLFPYLVKNNLPIFDQFMLVKTTLFHFSSIPSNGNHFYI